ncbi:MAG TPA: dethiobiotin synthase [Chitinophagaceae bacterium]|nr:dethiobiotin synthase [Chitinophagaceae bacterium]
MIFIRDHPVIFVTGIGTGVGKTLVAAILTEALGADYWKPVQSGMETFSDTAIVRSLVSNSRSHFLEETYRLKTPVSPHTSARIDGVDIVPEKILADFKKHTAIGRPLVIEGAGGLMVPLNDHYLYCDLIQSLQIPVIVVSMTYLGSINHSLLTAITLKSKGITALGWVFNRSKGMNETDIVRWSGIPWLASIPDFAELNRNVVMSYAREISRELQLNESLT